MKKAERVGCACCQTS
ncbi:hypothetical protein BRM22_15500 [Xanthomonas oryzae pv. oryzae]|nr:hypothetical protein BRM60_06645 [Xanthomonas oryzae pv. oryzae]QBG90211.1 hypothetical protein EYC54_16050 [Xanthomonas oryzae]QGH67991.1 hypothetical protein GHV42_15595 [Xanthomonas oryzae pv. oryzicola]AXM15379.1 hypothetical protein BRN32_06735 [Xanthomonas oryzae pv. oryzae]AXM19120.1 hypothetical protein BRN66_06615 [Xanthomonas oryzae pv. oryzae]